MIEPTRPITRVGPVMVISTMLSYQPAYAGEPDSSGSMASRISAEVNRAISDLALLANDIRADKPAKGELSSGLGRGSIYPYHAINGSDMALRANNLRNVARQSSMLPVEASEENAAFITADHYQDKDGYSVTLGGDYLFNEHYLLGVALGLPFDESEEETGESEIDGLVASGYFSYFRDDWYVDFSASYAQVDTDIERRISHYSDSVINDSSEADSDIWVFSLGSGYVVNYNYLNVTFESSLQYTLSDTERYHERLSKGNSNYLISKVDDIDNLESTMLIAGVSISQPLRSSLGIFQPYVRGYVHYDIDSGQEKIISQLKADNSGSILPIIVDSDDSIYGRVHVGISGAFNRDWKGYAEASSLIGLDDLSAYTFTLGVSISLD